MLNRSLGPVAGASPASISVALGSIRQHLGMEIAYISQFVGDRSFFREVDAPGLEHLIKPGDSLALSDVYCPHILSGRLPELMPNTANFPLAAAMPITARTPIGAHASVPIRDADGTAIGMFCCLSPTPNATLNDRDLQVLRVFADMAAHQIRGKLDVERADATRRSRMEQTIGRTEWTVAYQPIWDFRTGRLCAFEALCRFSAEPYRSPDKWFAEAWAAGLGPDLECAVIATAVDALPALPNDVVVSVNASPETILSGRLPALLAHTALRRLVIEITEHAPVSDYEALRNAIAPLRRGGARVAIDDAGAGFASLQHIVQLKPEIIKLDIGLTRGVNSDPARRALAAALIYFAQETDSAIVAEGIETKAERDTLTALGVMRGQGYFLGRPVPLHEAQALLRQPIAA